MDVTSFSASKLAVELNAGTITTESLCSTLIERIQDHAHLNAFTSFDPEALLHNARQADKEQKVGRGRGPLHGVPIIIKDNINTTALPTSGGTPALKGNVPKANAQIVERLLGAGALLAGKANLHELSSGGTSANHIFGATQNPYNLTHTPGGSSGGTASAVAARLVPAGLGSDTMGSVRVPASLCGLFGFRPTVGRYSADGLVPLTESFDTAGPLARSMDDIVLLDSLLAETSTPVPQRDLETITIGIAEDLMAETEGEVANIVRHHLIGLENAGATVKSISVADVMALRRDSAIDVMDVEFRDLMPEYLTRHASHVSMDRLVQSIASPAVKKFTADRMARSFDPAVYEQSIKLGRPKYDAAWSALFTENEIDAVAFPSTSDVALPSDEDDNVIKDGESVFSWFYFRHTALGSHARCPGISLPIGLNTAGLPVGLELDGLPGKDEELLSIARAAASVLDPLPAPAL